MQIKLSFPEEVVSELDRMRGDVTRSTFVRRLIEGVSSPATVLDAPTPEPERSPKPESKSKASREVPDEIPLPKIARRHWA